MLSAEADTCPLLLACCLQHLAKRVTEEKESVRREAFRPCREAWLMGGLG